MCKKSQISHNHNINKLNFLTITIVITHLDKITNLRVNRKVRT